MKITDRKLSRRQFVNWSAGVLGMSAAGGLLGCAGPAERSGAQTRRGDVPIGVQLYSVRHQLPDDVAGTMTRLAQIGFEGVEFADYHGLTATEWRALLDEHGLRCCGSHVYIDDLTGNAFSETVEFNQILENPYLIIRWIEEGRRADRDFFLRTVEFFNDTAARLEPYGMRIGYHSHDFIFETFDGEQLWDILARNTRDDVILQLDTGPAARMDQDPVELLHRHAGRTATMHVKAHSDARPAAYLGDDDLDWERIVEAAESVGGIEWYILEYEIEGVPPLPALEASLANFRQITGRAA
jgi:sugar phosphate isomerase/epimerase